MLQVVENERIDLSAFLEFSESRIEKLAVGSRATYSRAINNFKMHLSLQGNGVETSLYTLLADWLLSRTQGFSLKTTLPLFNVIAALYSHAAKEGVMPQTSAFKNLKVKLKDACAESGQHGYDSAFERLRAVVSQGRPSLKGDLMLFALLSGARHLKEVARLQKDSCAELDGELLRITQRNISPRRKYVFDLQQTQCTERQLDAKVDNLVLQFFKANNLPYSATADETVRTYWAQAALRCGVPGSDIMGILGVAPGAMPLLKLFSPGSTDGQQRTAIIRAVEQALMCNRLRWFAMKLRPRVSIDELRQRISSAENIDVPEIFYPLEAIAKKINKKIVYEQQPIIKDVAFFRSRITDIPALMGHVGDIAWCYKTGGPAGSTYASISEASFIAFQNAIGQYADDYRELNAGAPTPSINDRVTVTNGPFQGLEARLSAITTDDGNDIWRLFYAAPNGIRWTLTVDPRQARVISQQSVNI